MAAKAGDVQIALFHVGGHASGRATALDVDDNQRNLRHHRPTDRFPLKRNARARGPGDGTTSAPTGANGHGDRSDFVFALDENTVVFGQFASK